MILLIDYDLALKTSDPFPNIDLIKAYSFFTESGAFCQVSFDLADAALSKYKKVFIFYREEQKMLGELKNKLENKAVIIIGKNHSSIESYVKKTILKPHTYVDAIRVAMLREDWPHSTEKTRVFTYSHFVDCIDWSGAENIPKDTPNLVLYRTEFLIDEDWLNIVEMKKRLYINETWNISEKTLTAFICTEKALRIKVVFDYFMGMQNLEKLKAAAKGRRLRCLSSWPDSKDTEAWRELMFRAMQLAYYIKKYQIRVDFDVRHSPTGKAKQFVHATSHWSQEKDNGLSYFKDSEQKYKDKTVYRRAIVSSFLARLFPESVVPYLFIPTNFTGGEEMNIEQVQEKIAKLQQEMQTIIAENASQLVYLPQLERISKEIYSLQLQCPHDGDRYCKICGTEIKK